MKNTFIQSFMNDKTETFLEIGSTITDEFDSIPTTFNVTSNNTRWITINNKKLSNLLVKWNLTIEDVKTSLQGQFGKKRLIISLK